MSGFSGGRAEKGRGRLTMPCPRYSWRRFSCCGKMVEPAHVASAVLMFEDALRRLVKSPPCPPLRGRARLGLLSPSCLAPPPLPNSHLAFPPSATPSAFPHVTSSSLVSSSRPSPIRAHTRSANALDCRVKQCRFRPAPTRSAQQAQGARAVHPGGECLFPAGIQRALLAHWHLWWSQGAGDHAERGTRGRRAGASEGGAHRG